MSDWLDEILDSNAASAPKKEPEAAVPAPRRAMKVGRPIHPNAWGSGGKSNPLPGEEAPVSTVSTAVGNTSETTPAEAYELRKRKETKKAVKVPPKPTEPPTVHEISKSEETPVETETPSGAEAAKGESAEEETKGRIRAALAKAHTVTGSAKEKVAEKTAPVRKKAKELNEEINPRHAKKWSLLWAAGASWVVAPGTVGALYDRGVMLFGSWTENFPRAQYLNSGGLPHEWDLLHGPAWWVKGVVGAAWETGLTNELLTAVLVGLLPTVSLMHLQHRIFRFFTIIGVAYFIGFEWFPHWWEVYMAALAACAYYGWTMANRIQSAFLACVLRVPVAAIVSGSILYSPGAIF
jgi:hypothetical protein